MTTYTVEGHITKIVTMNICAEDSKTALQQAEKYIENGTYDHIKTESRLVSIA
jgi:hypothetical protein